MPSEEKSVFQTKLGYRNKVKGGAALPVAELRFSGDVSADHEFIEADNCVFYNMWCPKTPISLAVLIQQNQQPKKLSDAEKKTYSAFLLEEYDEADIQSRMKAISAQLKKAIDKKKPVFLSEMPSPDNSVFQKYFTQILSSLGEQERQLVELVARRDFVPTDTSKKETSKFGLGIIVPQSMDVELILDNEQNREKYKVLLDAIAAVKIGDTPRAALYKIGDQLYMNAHMDWSKPVESAMLIKTAVENNVVFGGDTNIQTLDDAKLSARNFEMGYETYKKESVELLDQLANLKTLQEISPEDDQEKGIKEIEGKIRALNLQYTHYILKELEQAGKVRLFVAGNTLDIFAGEKELVSKVEVTSPAIKLTALENKHTLFGLPVVQACLTTAEEAKANSEQSGQKPAL